MKNINKNKYHTDGSICLEGTDRVPAHFKACCNNFKHHTKACVYDIRYEWWAKQRNWVIVISETAGGGGIAISFCPHCGKKLKGNNIKGRIIEI